MALAEARRLAATTPGKRATGPRRRGRRHRQRCHRAGAGGRAGPPRCCARSGPPTPAPTRWRSPRRTSRVRGAAAGDDLPPGRARRGELARERSRRALRGARRPGRLQPALCRRGRVGRAGGRGARRAPAGAGGRARAATAPRAWRAWRRCSRSPWSGWPARGRRSSSWRPTRPARRPSWPGASAIDEVRVEPDLAGRPRALVARERRRRGTENGGDEGVEGRDARGDDHPPLVTGGGPRRPARAREAGRIIGVPAVGGYCLAMRAGPPEAEARLVELAADPEGPHYAVGYVEGVRRSRRAGPTNWAGCSSAAGRARSRCSCPAASRRGGTSAGAPADESAGTASGGWAVVVGMPDGRALRRLCREQGPWRTVPLSFTEAQRGRAGVRRGRRGARRRRRPPRRAAPDAGRRNRVADACAARGGAAGQLHRGDHADGHAPAVVLPGPSGPTRAEASPRLAPVARPVFARTRLNPPRLCLRTINGHVDSSRRGPSNGPEEAGQSERPEEDRWTADPLRRASAPAPPPGAC